MRPLTPRYSPIWLLAAVLCAAGAASGAPELSDGEGKQEVEQVCTSCHSLQPIISERHTEAEWRAVVDRMAALGAQGTDDEFNTSVEYLSRNYGKSRPSWWLYGIGAGLIFGGLFIGCCRRTRRRHKLENRPAAG